MNVYLNEEQKNRFNEVFDKVGDRLLALNDKDQQAGRFLRYPNDPELKGLIAEVKSVCLTMVPDHWPSLVAVANLLRRLGEDAEALALLEIACQLEHLMPMIPMEISITATWLKDADKALYYAEEAMRRSPYEPDLHANYALNLLCVSRDIEALDVIEQALRIEPDNVICQHMFMLVTMVISGECERPTMKGPLGE